MFNEEFCVIFFNGLRETKTAEVYECLMRLFEHRKTPGLINVLELRGLGGLEQNHARSILGKYVFFSEEVSPNTKKFNTIFFFVNFVKASERRLLLLLIIIMNTRSTKLKLKLTCLDNK